MYDLIQSLFCWSYPLLKNWGINNVLALYISLFINIALLWVCAYLIYFVFRFLLVTVLAVVANKTKTKFDDLLIDNNTAKYISYLIPFLFVYRSVPVILKDFVMWESLFGKMVGIYIVFLSLWVIRSILKSIRDYLQQQHKYADKPINSYVQVIMIVLWIFGFIVIIYEIFDVPRTTILGTFGGISAIIILIFRDVILGFVASVQVSLNDSVRIGDWISFDKFGADGDVIEINLTTIKVRNFDNTTTSIPTYSLISDSFRNWRGMLDSDGRRIKRHILIKARSIRFLTEQELQNLKKIQLVSKYIDERQQEIDKYNSTYNVDKSLLVNGRNLTNFGLFRKYITTYLEYHPSLNSNMTLVCRQLQPTHQGTPLEIYAFSKNQSFEEYEYVVSDIFDHILASVVYFDLEIFETPTDRKTAD